MTTVTFYMRDGRYTGFDAEGHAMYASHGRDIVCAAISVLTITTVNAIEELNHEEIECGKKEGSLTFRLLSEKDRSTQKLLETLKFGLENIRDEYGDGYLEVMTKEA